MLWLGVTGAAAPSSFWKHKLMGLPGVLGVMAGAVTAFLAALLPSLSVRTAALACSPEMKSMLWFYLVRR